MFDIMLNAKQYYDSTLKQFAVVSYNLQITGNRGIFSYEENSVELETSCHKRHNRDIPFGKIEA